LLLQDDPEIHQLIKTKEKDRYVQIREIVDTAKKSITGTFEYGISVQRQEMSVKIIKKVLSVPVRIGQTVAETLSRLTMSMWVGIPVLLLVLYFGLYQLVGKFAAGTLVDLLENKLFGEFVLPPVNKLFTAMIPWDIIRQLFIGEYGMITLGLRYAIAIILPIVTTFFFVFAVIEDTGYLPRLAMLIDRIFKIIGLSGRAVIPMVLGLGCGTMATLVTRTLPTKRERVIATLLLAVAVPCSAQLGVIMALLSRNTGSLVVWAGVLIFVYLVVGTAAAKLIPGEPPMFFMEIPPLRLPKIGNLLIKTYSRMVWYFEEIFPVFILASILIWFGQIIGLFDLLVKMLRYPVNWVGLPDQAAVSYLFGFFRRDYGTAGLYDLNKAGLLTPNQLVVSMVIMTLFLPCIAQFLVTIKERGIKTGITIALFTFVVAFSVGYVLNMFLNVTGINL
jgi:ferrous iron transport protein B